VCGGASVSIFILLCGRGLSPRVRGSPDAPPHLAANGGSIPACAGEPFRQNTAGIFGRVYPRVCGGATHAPAARLVLMGLSPRVRGSHVAARKQTGIGGSIPACAGEPWLRPWARFWLGVYPRVCGGAMWRRASKPASVGLSPRVRGSQTHKISRKTFTGSIPACAGEPQDASHFLSLLGVYPRVCGGAFLGGHLLLECHGLSPRVRGSPRRRQGCACHLGSIPACAGEP